MLYKKCRHTLTVYCEVHAEKAATAVNRIQNITFTCTAVACLFASLGTIATTAAATSYNKIIQLIIEAIQVIIMGFFFCYVFHSHFWLNAKIDFKSKINMLSWLYVPDREWVRGLPIVFLYINIPFHMENVLFKLHSKFT